MTRMDDVELDLTRVAREHAVIPAVGFYDHGTCAGCDWTGFDHAAHVAAEQVRMLRETWGLVEEVRAVVTGEPGPGYPPYRFEWTTERYGDTAEAEARAFCELDGWADGPNLTVDRRLVTDYRADTATTHPTAKETADE